MSLGIRTGNVQVDAITFVAASDSASNVVITIQPDNRVVTIDTMTITGNDRTTPGTDGLSHVCYTGNVIISGLKEFTKYSYSATNAEETKTGTFYTAPSRHNKGKFSLAFTTCLKNNAPNDSIYHFLNWYRQNTNYPLIANIHPDDVCYADSGGFDDGNKLWDGDAPYYNAVIGNTYLSEYNFSFYYYAWFGLSNTSDTNVDALTKDYVQDFFSNVSFMPQAGDHEYVNNIWNIPNLTTVSNPLHATAANYDGVARKAWNAFMGPLMGNQLGVFNAESHHWEMKVGGIQIISPDCISNTSATTTAVTDVTSAFGTEQIEEILTAVNNDYPFKLIANPVFALRGGASYIDYEYKVEQYLQSEVNRLFLDDGAAGLPLSIMNNPYTNGNIGVTVTMRGDNHFGKCWKFTNPAIGNNLAESYYEIGLMAANGGKGGSSSSREFSYYEPLPSGTEFVGGTGGSPFGSQHRSCTIVEYDNTGDVPIMTIKRYDYNWSDDTGLPDVIPDETFYIEDGLGPDGLYAMTFKKVFAPFQSTNLGHDSEADIKGVRGISQASTSLEA